MGLPFRDKVTGTPTCNPPRNASIRCHDTGTSQAVVGTNAVKGCLGTVGTEGEFGPVASRVPSQRDIGILNRLFRSVHMSLFAGILHAGIC